MPEGFPSITKEKSLQQSFNKSRNSFNFIECHNSPFETVITIKSSRFDLTILTKMVYNCIGLCLFRNIETIKKVADELFPPQGK